MSTLVDETKTITFSTALFIKKNQLLIGWLRNNNMEILQILQ